MKTILEKPTSLQQMQDFLLAKKHPLYKAAKASTTLSGTRQSTVGSPLSHERKQEIIREGNAYKEELKAMPPTDVMKKYHEAKQNDANNKKQKDLYAYPADYEHWCKLSFWSMEEAIALSIGKDPHKVNLDSVNEYKNYFPFAKDYMNRYELLKRAEVIKAIYRKPTPMNFIKWADSVEISYPAELREYVEKYHKDNDIDYKAKTEELAQELEQLKKEKRLLCEAADNMREKLTELQNTDKPLDARERTSLLTMIAGMATGGYGHNFNATRSDTAKQIETDIITLGLSLTDDTIRRWLQEAGELIDQDALTE